MVLVTGGTGLVGTHLLLQLAKEGTSVRAIFRDANSILRTKKVFSYYSSDPQALFSRIQWVAADITDLVALQAAFDQVTHVYHCAALISFDPADFERLKKVNAEGTANVVNLCIAKGVKKLCYTSSVATVGQPASGLLATEEDYTPRRNPTVYAISKQSAEMEVWRGSQEGIQVVIVNPGIILGPGFWDSGSGVVFGMGAKGRALAPPGGTGFVGVTDVVQIMAALMHSSLHNERYIVVAANMTFKSLLTVIANACKKAGPNLTIPIWCLQLVWRLDWLRRWLTGGKRVLTKNTVESLRHSITYDNQKIIGALGYEFGPLEESIAFCCQCMKEEETD